MQKNFVKILSLNMECPKCMPAAQYYESDGILESIGELKSKEPIFITKNGYGDMVIMSMELYEQKISLLDPFTKLEAAETNVQEGKVLDAEEGLISIRKKYSV